MTIIAPTITTNDPAVYARRLEDFLTFAPRIQIDITDGQFAPSQTINLNQVYWPPADKRECKIDLHLMLQRPIDWLDQIVAVVPDKVILHAESDDAGRMLPRIYEHLQRFGMQVGVALLPETRPADVADIIRVVDSVLIFGGHLGYQGGVADLTHLGKIPAIQQINSTVTIEWDGGANLSNVSQIAAAASDPAVAYRQLVEVVS